MKSRISSTHHTVVLGPNLIGLGNLPAFTPAHHVELDTIIRGGMGGSAFLSPRICGNLINPVSGRLRLVLNSFSMLYFLTFL